MTILSVYESLGEHDTLYLCLRWIYPATGDVVVSESLSLGGGGPQYPRRTPENGDDGPLKDILAAIDAIRGHLVRGGVTGGLVFDAVRVRLIDDQAAAQAGTSRLFV